LGALTEKRDRQGALRQSKRVGDYGAARDISLTGHSCEEASELEVEGLRNIATDRERGDYKTE